MNEKILIVDDEEDILKYLNILLTEKGFRVKTASGGEEAIQILKSEPFEIIITDIRMPEMNGLDVMQQAKAIDEDIQVLILTGFATFKDAISALRNGGASDYLIKPLESADELFIALHRAFENRRLHIENKKLLSELKLAKTELENKVRERTQDLKQANRDLAESVKKLNCLFGISELRQKDQLSQDELIQGIIDLIPPAFQYPDICRVRVMLGSQVFETKGFEETSWKLTGAITVSNKTAGAADVCYLEEKPKQWQGPFQKEEVSLLNSVCERLGKIIEKKQADDALKKSYDELEQRVKERTEGLVAANNKLEWEMEAHKRAREGVLKSKNTLQSVFDGIPDPLMMFSQDMSVKMLNKAAKTYHQLPEGHEIAGDSCYDELLGNASYCEGCEIVPALAGRLPVSFERNGFKDRDKIEQVDIYPLKDGGSGGVIVRIADITEAKLIAKMKEENHLIEAANHAKTRFIANVSHELRSPLTAIIGFSNILQDGQHGSLNEKQKEYIDAIHQSGKHLLSLINDILDISKLEAGKMDFEPSPVPVREAMENSLLLIREKALKHNICLEVDIPSELNGLRIMADKRKFRQIMFNLLSNAVNFTPDQGTICVKMKQIEKAEYLPPGIRGTDQTLPFPSLLFSVEDTGVGIPPADCEKIFEEFYQSRNAVKSRFRGTGLGLSLTRHFVEMHGGKIWAANRENGAGIHFVLPLKSVSLEDQPEEKAAAGAIHIRDEDVLFAYLNMLIHSAQISSRSFTVCSLNTDQMVSKEKFSEIGEALQKEKREDDLLRIEGSGKIYLVLKDTDFSRAELTCRRLTQRINHVIDDGLNIRWNFATFPEHARTPETLLTKIGMLNPPGRTCGRCGI